jgi:hypothetical protein
MQQNDSFVRCLWMGFVDRMGSVYVNDRIRFVPYSNGCSAVATQGGPTSLYRVHFHWTSTEGTSHAILLAPYIWLCMGEREVGYHVVPVTSDHSGPLLVVVSDMFEHSQISTPYFSTYDPRTLRISSPSRSVKTHSSVLGLITWCSFSVTHFRNRDSVAPTTAPKRPLTVIQHPVCLTVLAEIEAHCTKNGSPPG